MHRTGPAVSFLSVERGSVPARPVIGPTLSRIGRRCRRQKSMAIYTTFFLARPDELGSGFPGWKLPLPAPVRREFRNWFTKQIVTVETREPEWPEEEQQNEM